MEIPKDSSLKRAFRAILYIVFIVVVITTIYVIMVPKVGEKFTEFYILGENGKAADYPTDLIGGNPEQVIIGIGNHEYQNTTYVVEVWLTNVTFDSTTNATNVIQIEKLDQFSVSLMHNETYQAPHQITPTALGNQLTFLLFKGAAPSDSLIGFERINSSYRNLRLWVTVKYPFEPNIESKV